MSVVHNIEQLLDLLLEEKHLRAQLQQQAETLQTEIEVNKWTHWKTKQVKKKKLVQVTGFPSQADYPRFD